MKSLLIPACVLCMASIALSASAFPPEVKTYSEKEAKKFLKNLNQEWAKKSASLLLARWEYEEGLTSSTLERMKYVRRTKSSSTNPPLSLEMLFPKPPEMTGWRLPIESLMNNYQLMPDVIYSGGQKFRALWNFASLCQLKTASDVARYRKQQRKEVIRYPKDKIADIDVRRQLELFSRLGPDGLSEEKFARFQAYVAELGVAPTCLEQGCGNPGGNIAGAEERFACWRSRRYGPRARKVFNEILALLADMAEADTVGQCVLHPVQKYFHSQPKGRSVKDRLALYKECCGTIFEICFTRVGRKVSISPTTVLHLLKENISFHAKHLAKKGATAHKMYIVCERVMEAVRTSTMGIHVHGYPLNIDIHTVSTDIHEVNMWYIHKEGLDMPLLRIPWKDGRSDPDLTDVTSVLFHDLERPDDKGGNAAENQAEDLSAKLGPLYQLLHKYWRSRLHTVYRDASPIDQPIMDHLREAPVCDADPIPNKPLDLSGAMRSKGFTKRRLVEMAAEFFSSLNMSAMPDSLWTLSLLEKEANRTIPCYSTAVDFLDNKDYRIRLCGQLEGETLVTAAVLVGRVIASMELRPLAGIYRSPDPVVADAVGVLAALSLLSPSQLRQAGLLAGDDSSETAVNVLHQVARAIVAPALRSLAADLWRIRVAKAGPKPPLNAIWWNLVLKIEGVQPPINRTERDFDAASVPPLLGDPLATPLRSTLGMALGFQLHSVLCQQAGLFDPQEPERMPLHQCNLYSSPVASKALKSLLQYGLSQPWPVALKEAFTVSASPATVDVFSSMASAPPSADPILQYFQPLMTWLVDTLNPNGETLNFSAPDFACPKCRRSLSGKDAKNPASHIHQCQDGAAEDDTDDIALTTSPTSEQSANSPRSLSAEVTSSSNSTTG